MKYARLKLECKEANDIYYYLTSYKSILITLDTLQDNYVRVNYGNDYLEDLQKMIDKLHYYVKNY